MLLQYSKQLFSFQSAARGPASTPCLKSGVHKLGHRNLLLATAETATAQVSGAGEPALRSPRDGESSDDPAAQASVPPAEVKLDAEQSSQSMAEPTTTPKLASGTVLDLTCYALSTTGKGICRTDDNFVVFVPRAIPGERVKVKVKKVDARSAEASIVETLSTSPLAAKPPCQHFATCGGCSHQHLAYAAQLEQKHNWAVEAMRRIGGVDNIDSVMRSPVGCEEPYKYRNKMTFALNTNVQSLEKARRPELSQQPTVGLYSRERPDTIFEVEKCWLQDDTSNEILATIKEYITSIQDTGRIVIEKIVIRKGLQLKKKTPEYMVIFHTWVRPRATPPTAEEAAIPFIPMVERVRKDFPAVVSLYDCRAVVGREKAFPILNRLSGKEFLVHFAGDMPFHVDPLAFFQTNTEMAGKLVELVYEAAGLKKNDVLVDLYCGVGSLGIACAVRQQQAKRPVERLNGFDIYNQAAQNAKANAKILGLKHKTYRFKSGDLTQPTLGATDLADVIIADPARSGLGESTVDYALKSQARTLVYVSCDVATQARDIAMLTEPKNERSYWLESVQICDMFPQTSHVESVAVLRRDVVNLPDYVRPGKKDRKRLKTQKIQKQIVPTADLPWIDGGNPEILRLKTTGRSAPTKFSSILGTAPAGGSGQEGEQRRQEGLPPIIRGDDTAQGSQESSNRRARRDLLFGRKPKPTKKKAPPRKFKSSSSTESGGGKSSRPPPRRQINFKQSSNDLDW